MYNIKNNFWYRDDSLSIFLSMLILFIFILGPLCLLFPSFESSLYAVFSLVLILGIRATVRNSSISILAIGSVLLALAVNIIHKPNEGQDYVKIFPEVCELLVILLCLFVVLKNTLKPGPITTHRIKGAIASYLLIALVWGKAYTVLYLILPNSFSGIGTLKYQSSLIYFSFVTLSTLGYGDITPLHTFARSLATAEALIGQLFPAIFIARLVGLQVDDSRKRSDAQP